ncbi:MAG: serine hydrolase [Brevundimonas sp.]|uniref:D-alanyl-D-alanine carboxypeptidase family protein n=1 Tax=Brevundimonas sp. TaxID=1871086 RepID=UPI0025C296B1|nr:serine hydrolase [Brevundimonas sp.]MBX3477897.1 serine hydrolase [Brevundimonas sp.]
MLAFARRGFLALIALALLTATPSPGPAPVAQAPNVKYAAIVVDAESGEVLFARHADSRRYPASITKVMTLYLTFEALAEGRVKPDDILTVSPHAASQPPSKLGLGAGQTITLDDAMKAMAVRSANDMAVAIAEHVGGSEARFAAMMTVKARDLGMTDTRYVNANGLPDSRQITTARDLAVLSRAVMRDYPQYYRYFGLHDWAYNGREYRNTNGLLASGHGYDGMKTGYTNASGYNLAASAVRDGRRLITVVLGGRSSASRNAHVAELMDVGFDVERMRAQGQLIPVAQTVFEARGYGVDTRMDSGPLQYASASDEDQGGSTAVSYASLPAAPPQIDRVIPAPSQARVQASGDLTASLNGAPAAAPARRAAAPATRAAPARPAGRWAVQVGAFRDEQVARDWLSEVGRRFRSQFAEAGRDIQRAGEWRRSRFTGMTEDAAVAACRALAERRVTCMVVRPD